MAYAVSEAARPFELGRIIGKTIEVFRQRFWTLFPLALLIGGGTHAGLTELAYTMWPQTWPTWSADLAYEIFAAPLNAILLSLITGIAGAHLGEHALDLGSAVRRTGAMLVALIFLSFVVLFGVTLGLLLLAIPGIILSIYWSVCVPAMTQEKLPVFAALERSADLTSGYRWGIFGLGIISAVLNVALFYGVERGLDLVPPEWDGVIFFSIQLTANIVSGAISALLPLTGIAVIYFELRRVKEGLSAPAVVSVFD